MTIHAGHKWLPLQIIWGHLQKKNNIDTTWHWTMDQFIYGSREDVVLVVCKRATQQLTFILAKKNLFFKPSGSRSCLTGSRTAFVPLVLININIFHTHVKALWRFHQQILAPTQVPQTQFQADDSLAHLFFYWTIFWLDFNLFLCRETLIFFGPKK